MTANTPKPARLLDCGFCYEEQGEEVHPHPECPIGRVTQPARYRRTPAEIEAVQWTGTNTGALRAFAGSDFDTIDPEDRIEDPDQDAQLLVEDSHWVGIKPGDWVVKYEGYFVAKADATFRAVWEPAAVSVPPPADQTAEARRERYATAISKWHRDPEQPLYTQGAEAVIAIADAEQAELRRERDLAVAHDRQPYPTAWAYEQACKALHKHRDRADAAEAALARIQQMADYWEQQLPEVIRTPAVVSAIRAALERVNGPSRVAAEEQAAETLALSVDPDAGCPHCPDGHQDPERGSQPWSAWVAHYRDGDGQPMQISVARSAGAHVAESDAQWVRERLNAPAREVMPLDHPMRRECRCSEAGVCQRCAERPSAAAVRPAVGEQPETQETPRPHTLDGAAETEEKLDLTPTREARPECAHCWREIENRGRNRWVHIPGGFEPCIPQKPGSPRAEPRTPE